MRRLLSVVGAVYTAKSVWWDKLPPEDQKKYIAAAKKFINGNKETLIAKGQEFKAKQTAPKGDSANTPV